LGILRELSPARLLFSSRADQVYDLPEDVEWAPDEREDGGPLEGIRRCLRIAAPGHVLCLAVDLPRMTPAYLRGLLESCDVRSGVVPKLGTHWEPLVAVYPAAALRIAEEQMAAGRLALQEFVERLSSAGLIHTVVVSAADSLLFHNVNTPEDWEA